MVGKRKARNEGKKDERNWVQCEECDTWWLYNPEEGGKEMEGDGFWCGRCLFKEMKKMKTEFLKERERERRRMNEMEREVEELSEKQTKFEERLEKECKDGGENRKGCKCEEKQKRMEDELRDLRKEMEKVKRLEFTTERDGPWKTFGKIDGQFEETHGRETKMQLQVPLREKQMVKQYKEIQMLTEKRKNVMVFGAEEEMERNDLLELLSKVWPEEEEEVIPREIKRVGKRIEGKKRPVMMCFESEETARRIMSRAKILRQCEKFRNIFLEQDRTREERDELKMMKERMVQNRKKGLYSVIRNNVLICHPFSHRREETNTEPKSHEEKMERDE